MNNIIFLDIDGVLNNPEYIRNTRLKIGDYEFFKNPFYYSIDPKKIELLNKIIEVKDINIVISSTWRRKGIRETNEVFKEKGLNKEIEHITTLREMDRGLQILEFIDIYETNNYAVVDDDISTIDKYIPFDRIIHIDGHKGLELDDIKNIEKLMV